MSVCDTRRYYPVNNGIFKIRSSDGDLVWDSRAVSVSATQVTERVSTRIDKLPSGKIIYSGIEPSGYSRILIVQQDASGILSSLTKSDQPATTLTGTGTIIDQRYVSDHTADYMYAGAFKGTYGLLQVTMILSRFSHSGTYQGGRSILQSAGIMSAVQGTAYVDAITGIFGTFIERYDSTTSAAATLSVSAGRGGYDRNNRIVSDGTYYYVPPSGGIGMRKIAISTLAVAATATATTTLEEGDVSGGVLAYCSNAIGIGVAAWSTAAMTSLFSPAALFTGRCSGCSACDSFVAAIGSNAAFTTSTAKRLELDGTVTWSRDLIFSDYRATATDFRPKVVISQDKTKVYVYGPFNNATALSASDLRIALYCLSAADGSILWRFSAGTASVASGSLSGAGMNLYDDGDHVYLGVVNTEAPRYR